MSEIPQNEVTEADLHTWFNLNQELTRLKNAEQLLRMKIFKGKFPNPREGTNNFLMPDGYVLKGKHNINRTVEEAAFKGSIEELAKNGIPTDTIVKFKPELVTSVYRELTEEQRNLFDTVLIIKDGMPGLEISKPKRAVKQA